MLIPQDKLQSELYDLVQTRIATTVIFNMKFLRFLKTQSSVSSSVVEFTTTPVKQIKDIKFALQTHATINTALQKINQSSAKHVSMDSLERKHLPEGM